MAKKWSGRYPKLCDWVAGNIEETLTFYRHPRQHHKNLKSTNLLERLNEEIKRRTMAFSVSSMESPVNGRFPLSTSYKTVPKLKISDRASSGRPCACSGDIYGPVPRSGPSVVCVNSIPDSSRTFASPKSSSFAPVSDVGRLQIAMQDAVLVRRFQGAGDLQSQGQGFGGGQRSLEWRALDEFEHQIIRTHIKDLADVGVVQGGDGSRFLLEPCAALGPEALIATMRFSLVSRALYTSPMPPAPIGARIS